MDRRGFLSLSALGLAATALDPRDALAEGSARARFAAAVDRYPWLIGWANAQPRAGWQPALLEGQWPAEVTGCAAVVERLVLPPDVDAQIPDDPTEAEEFAREHPLRQEVRIVAGATRAGATYCALRLRAHDDDQSVADGTELVPGLLDLLRSTLEGDIQ